MEWNLPIDQQNIDDDQPTDEEFEKLLAECEDYE